MRLSRDDEKGGESVSIEHQRIILNKYVAEKGGRIIDEYIDDGLSGTNFERPGVKRMLQDAQTGKIDTIVVKDLSRFGRNYIQVGQYIDYIFPAYGVRFIAINDNVDTADRTSAAMDMMPVMNVFNEWHAANTSKKIRAVLDASQRSGRYTNWSYPYGYTAGKDENRTAVVDEKAASVVRRIFNLRAEGNSYRTIARILTGDGIPNPATYFTRLDGKKTDRRCSPFWNCKTVMHILSDPTYTGVTVQHKTTGVSYKNHKVIKIPENERIVKKNAHEPIISRRLWDRVQTAGKSVATGRKDNSDKVHALSGLLVCPDCGKKFKLKSTKKGRNYFYCRTYIDLGAKYCSSHGISESEIESVVLRDIQSMLSPVAIDGAKARERFIRLAATRGERNCYEGERRLKACKERLAELDKLIKCAFEEKVFGGLPESVCVSLCENYQKEKTALENEIEGTELSLAEKSNNEDAAGDYMRKLSAYVKCETLTREICLQLINFVTVGEKNGLDGSREIRIYYNLSGNGNCV